jgi:hypothetical protein
VIPALNDLHVVVAESWYQRRARAKEAPLGRPEIFVAIIFPAAEHREQGE